MPLINLSDVKLDVSDFNIANGVLFPNMPETALVKDLEILGTSAGEFQSAMSLGQAFGDGAKAAISFRLKGRDDVMKTVTEMDARIQK
jgi:hypothetical protein